MQKESRKEIKMIQKEMIAGERERERERVDALHFLLMEYVQH